MTIENTNRFETCNFFQNESVILSKPMFRKTYEYMRDDGSKNRLK